MTARLLPNIPHHTYHQDDLGGDTPTLSAGIIRTLLTTSPAHAHAQHPKLNPAYEAKQEERFDVGTAAHRLLLEGDNAIEVIAADNWRTTAAREHRDQARANGRIPLLPADADKVVELAAAIRVHVDTLMIQPTPFTNGTPEITATWDMNGVACRARIDWLHHGHKTIDDLKTTTRSASPEGFSKTLYTMGYHIQARFYQRSVEAAAGFLPDFRFVVAETTEPYAVTVFALTPAGEALADTQIAWAVETWKRCLEADEWPAYPNRICYAEPPGWAESQWLEREYRETLAA